MTSCCFHQHKKIIQHGDLSGFPTWFRYSKKDMEIFKETGNDQKRPNLSTIFYRSILRQRLLNHTSKLLQKNIDTQTTHGKIAEMIPGSSAPWANQPLPAQQWSCQSQDCLDCSICHLLKRARNRHRNQCLFKPRRLGTPCAGLDSHLNKKSAGSAIVRCAEVQLPGVSNPISLRRCSIRRVA